MSRPLLALALAAALAACGGDERDAERALAGYAAATLDGDSVSVADLRGEVALVNVWATWCAPCRQEIPELEALHRELGPRGLRVVGVTVDSRHAGADVRSFIDQMGMTYDVWWDPEQRIVNRLEAAGVPVTVLLDREGRIIWSRIGVLQRQEPELMDAIEAALRDRAAPGSS